MQKTDTGSLLPRVATTRHAPFGRFSKGKLLHIRTSGVLSNTAVLKKISRERLHRFDKVRVNGRFDWDNPTATPAAFAGTSNLEGFDLLHNRSSVGRERWYRSLLTQPASTSCSLRQTRPIQRQREAKRESLNESCPPLPPPLWYTRSRTIVTTGSSTHTQKPSAGSATTATHTTS